MSSIEDASKVSRYCDASCQADYESLMDLPDFEAKVNCTTVKIVKIYLENQNVKL